MSLTHLQIESGTFSQVLFYPFNLTGHLGTKSMVKCTWEETEPYDIHQRTPIKFMVATKTG
jgi:hypothetical protein